MPSKNRSALEAATWRSSTDLWIDHATISADETHGLSAVEKLTLWNVTYPADLFANMPRLWWLDIRGGTVKSFHSLGTARNLRYLRINQIRGLPDLSDIQLLGKLELLSLYGLPKVRDLPDLSGLSHLRRIEIGQMKGLQSLSPVWNAGQLEEILLIKDVPVEPQDIEHINRMTNLKAFSWEAMDIPEKRYIPIREGIALPKAQPLHASEWFEQKGA